MEMTENKNLNIRLEIKDIIEEKNEVLLIEPEITTRRTLEAL